MPITTLNLLEYIFYFFLMFNVETVLSVCDVRVRTIDLGCHLDWHCPDANPKTTYTVQTKTFGTWENVSDCIQISHQSCDLSRVFPDIHIYNFIRLTSEDFPGLDQTLLCDPLNDSYATFSPPNIIISMDNGSLWVTVNFPSLPCKICYDDDYDEEEEMACLCPINEFKKLLATVTLYNNQSLSDRQTHTGEVMRDRTHKVEFGFLLPGRVYCAVANFTAKGVLASSPMSLPQCVYIPANTESLIAVIVCAVLIALGLMIFLLWRHCASSERPLPRSLALLRDLELQKKTFIDSYKAAPHDKSFEGDHVSVVSICDFTFTDNQSSYQNNEYYTSHVLHDPDCIEYFTSPVLHDPDCIEYFTSPVLHDPDCIEGSVESVDLGVEVQNHKFHSFPSHPFLEANVQCEETPNIPLSSVQVKYTQQDETSAEDPELYGDVEIFKTEYETNKHGSELIQTTDGCSQKTEYI